MVSNEIRKSFCRFCHAYCAIEVEIRDGKPCRVTGDTDDPVYGGYTCLKGRELPAQYNSAERLKRTQKKVNGAFFPVETQLAIDEMFDKIQSITDRHGPRSVATYVGSGGYQNSASIAVAKAWHKSIGSPSFYSSITIDQTAKLTARSRFGSWGGGAHGFTGADVCMMFGNNPLVSHFSVAGGLPPCSPAIRLRREMNNGMKVIVVDPRRTETARRATLHLQLNPGQDATLLCGMIKTILDERLHDCDFCERYVDGTAELHGLLASFTSKLVADRCGIPENQLVEAAHLFAKARRGIAVSGTGADMAPNAVLTEHLLLVLNTLCGRYNRVGDQTANPMLLSGGPPARAQVWPPRPVYRGGGPKARVRGLEQFYGEMPTATLADEILLGGEGQIKALICIGGNPVVVFPDQDKTVAAMKKLDLLICVDMYKSATARLAHYIIAPTHSLERDDVTLLADPNYEEPYAHYTHAVLPAGEQTLEEWELYWELSQRSGIPINLSGGQLDINKRPAKREVIEKIVTRTRVPVAKLAQTGRGALYPDCISTVSAANTDSDTRFDLLPDRVAEEIVELFQSPATQNGCYIDGCSNYNYLLISRRVKHRYNSTGELIENLQRKGASNPAYLNPEDLEALQLKSGDLVRIESAAGKLIGVVEAAADVKRGVVSMSHGWGDSPEALEDVRTQGASTNRLVDDSRTYDPISGQPRMSAIPVNIFRYADG